MGVSMVCALRSGLLVAGGVALMLLAGAAGGDAASAVKPVISLRPPNTFPLARWSWVPADSSSLSPAISGDGRFVAFTSLASNLVAGDRNGGHDVFVRDLQARRTELVSASSAGVQAAPATSTPFGNMNVAVSADGRFIAFTSWAPNLVASDTNNTADVFVRDRLAGRTELASVNSAGVQADPGGFSSSPAISADGRFIAFTSSASNLVAGDSNGAADVFVRDRLAGTTERTSVGSDGREGNGDSGFGFPAISADGRFVAFTSTASSLVAGDTNDADDVFVRDRAAGTTERVSVSNSGAQTTRRTSPQPEKFDRGRVAISADGRFVAFASTGPSLVAGDTNDAADVFVRDRAAGTTERVSVSSTGAQTPGWWSDSWSPAISADGRFVAFSSTGPNLVAGDTNNAADVFVRDRAAGTTQRVSVSSKGTQDVVGGSADPTISADGRLVAFDAFGHTLVAGDTNLAYDIFVRDRDARTTELVSPGRRILPKAGRLRLQPWPPRARTRLDATLPVSAGRNRLPDDGARVSCTLTLDRRKQRTGARAFYNGAARCSWWIRASARGKRLNGSISATTTSGTASRRFTAVVR